MMHQSADAFQPSSPERDEPQLAVVTGGAGFIGSHLIKRLLAEGWRVISLDNYFTGSEENHQPGAEYRRGHTKDIAKHIPEIPHIIFHLGEYARVTPSLEEPYLVWEHNLTGSAAVLEWARTRSPAPFVVYAASSTKFAQGEEGRFLTPYTFAKTTVADLVQAYQKWFNLSVAIVYFYNVYGPGEPADERGTLIARLLAARRAGKPLPLRKPGTQRRHFTHVEDIVVGLLTIAHQKAEGEFSLGAPYDEYSIEEIARMIGGPIVWLDPLPGDRSSSHLDISAAQALGWQPRQYLADYIAQELRAMEQEAQLCVGG
ncbi:MAG: NAD dependent epimerase/dehydratase [Candidatus Parcubacteria bacterium]|nr:MAG: NAD dependent epimerase/dehydratase [Candidatus Parcubacteria bacterium]